MGRHRRVWQTAAWALLVALMGSVGWETARAADGFPFPTGGRIVYGDGYLTDGFVFQYDPFIVIRWDDFSVDQGWSVTFQQPHSYAVALNEVTGHYPSLIDGDILANGRVFLINPNGIIIGQNATLDVGSFLGSTLRLSYSNFQDLRDQIYDFVNFRAPLRFVRATDDFAVISVHGTLNLRPQDPGTPAGYIALMSESIYNFGTINARGGTALLAAGNGFYLHMNSDGSLALEADETAGGRGVLGTVNSSVIQADGGTIILSATGADSVLNLGGTVRATAIDNRDGRVVLSAGGGPVRLGYDVNEIITIDPVSSPRWLELEADMLDVTGEGQVVIEGYTDVRDNPHPTTIRVGTGRIEAGEELLVRAGANLEGDRLLLKAGGDLHLGADAVLAVEQLVAEAGVDVWVEEAVNVLGDETTLRAARDVNIVDSPTVNGRRLAVDAGRHVFIDVEQTKLLGFNLDVTELAVEAGDRIDITGRTRLEVGGATNSPLSLKARNIVLEGSFQRPAGEQFEGTAVIDAPYVDLYTSLFFPRIVLTNSTDEASDIRIMSSGSLSAMESIDVLARNGGGFSSQGRLSAPAVRLHLGGDVHWVYVADIIDAGGPDDTPRLSLFGADGPGTWLTADSVEIHASGDLRLSGWIRAGDVLVRSGYDPSWGARRDLIIEDANGSIPTQMDAARSVTLAAGRAFRNYSAYGGNLFPGAGRVVIFSATDRYGYDPGSLLALETPGGQPRFSEVYGVGYDEAGAYNPEGDTIYIGESEPSPVLTIPTLGVIEKVFDNTPVVIDPEPYLGGRPASGLRFRFDGGDGSGGINVGTYVIVPYGAESELYRIRYAGTGQLVVTPRPLCPLGCAGWAERVWGDLNPNFGVVWHDVFDLAPGHSAADAGLRFTVDMPGTPQMADVGQYAVFVAADPDNPAAKNYIFPEQAVGTLQVNPRPVRIRFFSGVVNDGQLPEGQAQMWNLVRIDNLPAFLQSPSLFAPYLQLYYTPAYVGPGVYELNYRIREQAPFLDNFIFEPHEPGVITVVANVDYYVKQSWKKLFPVTNVAQCWGDRSCDVQQAPSIGHFSGAAWPVMGKAVAAFLSSRGELRESAFLELLSLLTSPATRNETLGKILPFVMQELEDILSRPESTWSAAEQAFVYEFVGFVSDLRKEAAAAAMRDYEAWKAEDERRRTGVGGSGPVPRLDMLFYYGSEPPEHFLRQAVTGIYVPPSQSGVLDEIVAGVSSVVGAVTAEVAVTQLALSGALNTALLKVAPFAARLAAQVQPLAAASAFTGPAAIVVAGAITIGSAIADMVNIENYEENMQKALQEAQAGMTVDGLRQWLSDSYDVVASWMMLRFARPYAQPTGVPRIILAPMNP